MQLNHAQLKMLVECLPLAAAQYDRDAILIHSATQFKRGRGWLRLCEKSEQRAADARALEAIIIKELAQ